MKNTAAIAAAMALAFVAGIIYATAIITAPTPPPATMPELDVVARYAEAA